MYHLKDAEIVAAGHTRDVYRHPDDGALLIKVIRRSAIAERYGRGAPWYKFKRRRYRHLITYLREVREHIAVHAVGETHPSFLQRIVGFVDTDMGLGLVVEAVRRRDGTYAPTVVELVRQGRLDSSLMQKLDEFLDAVMKSPVLIADLNPFNVVYGYVPERDGDHFVLIDGIGHKNIIPLARMNAAINRWDKTRKITRFHAMIEKHKRAAAKSDAVA